LNEFLVSARKSQGCWALPLASLEESCKFDPKTSSDARFLSKSVPHSAITGRFSACTIHFDIGLYHSPYEEIRETVK